MSLLTLILRLSPVALLSLLLLSGCDEHSPLREQIPATKQQPATPQLPRGEQDAIVMASAAVKRHRLTALPDRCLSYLLESERSGYVVDVHENHTGTSCGGDPNTAPRLFTIRINKKTGVMSTDAGSLDGTFRTLKP